MNDIYKWIVLSTAEPKTKEELDRLSAEYESTPLTDPRFQLPAAVRLINSLKNPPFDDITVLCYPDPSYPEKLKILKNPPPVLYVRGNPQLLHSELSVAVVGSRNASNYGLSVTADFCRDFCEAGFTIISGGAKGVDSAAAETAIKFGGKTIAVFGCGIDVAYPFENRKLFDKIIKSGGALASEYPFGAKPIPAYFPQRNRIIAALSDGCVVTEAGMRSGSLITANMVSDLKKPLFAVPGNITSRNSQGANHLIKTGAYMAVSGTQAAAEIKMLLSFSRSEPQKKKKFVRLTPATQESEARTAEKKPRRASSKSEKKPALASLSPQEEKIISAIKAGKALPGEISEATGISGGELASALVMMELRGLIKKEYGEKYSV